MIFITEDDLRDLYKIEPFTDYEIKPGTRITPGARQFLADRGINMFDNVSWKNKKSLIKKQGYSSIGRKKKLCVLRLEIKLQFISALFLDAMESFLKMDVVLAQQTGLLYKCFSSLKSFLGEGDTSTINELSFEGCTGIHLDNYSDNMEDCFDITDFHIQLEKGKEIIILHKLRCALREFELDILEARECNDGDNKPPEEMLIKVNQIINILSQYICCAAGGKTCQKQ